jgi:hypothetical protein
MANDYLTTPEAQDYVGVDAARDTASLAAAVTTASRFIDSYCRRHFWNVTEARVFEADPFARVLSFGAFNDIAVSTGLVVKFDVDGNGTYERTLTDSDYVLRPQNWDSGEPTPYDSLQLTWGNRFPIGIGGRPYTVQITGTWGWPNGVPQAVKQACLIITSDLYRRADSPFGVVGIPDVGVFRMSRYLDSHAAMLLAPYRNAAGFGIA